MASAAVKKKLRINVLKSEAIGVNPQPKTAPEPANKGAKTEVTGGGCKGLAFFRRK
jgi:hypothetical protein